MSGDPYTRLVTFLKVALPLIALALLSTLFLLSSRIRPSDSIPFAEGEIAERMRGQQVTGPFFSGVTPGGDKMAFSARELVTGPNRETEARDLRAQLDFFEGGGVSLVAARGKVDMENDIATMLGDILIQSTTGYRMTTDTLTSSLSRIDLTAPAKVRATGPVGTLTAGRMRITSPESDGTVQLLFSDGVKLVYDPGTTTRQ